HRLPLHQSPLSNRATGKGAAPHTLNMPHSQHMDIAIRSPVDFVVGLAAALSAAVRDPV
ncbi:hypothetical protein C0995_011658, partial [Termitomyces sp. Mi166